MIGANKNFAATAPFVAYTAFATPASLDESNDAGSVTTITTTVNVTGGLPPYTYLWTKVSGKTIAVNSPTSATTSFSIAGSNGDSFGSTYKCTVTDDASAVVSANVEVSFFFGEYE